MLQNVIDIDEAAMRISLRHPHGAIVLFDFESAFPSLAHSYLWEALIALGMPGALVNAIRCFYTNNVHTIKVKGQRFPSMTSRSGIRQGCPLSPLLFAVVADVLLRKLTEHFPESIVKAFADDTAMALTDFHSQAGGVMRLFREFASLSGLRLSMPKTVVIPLWKYTPSSFDGYLKDTLPEWHRAKVANCGKYLGYMTGPGKGSLSWQAPVAKYEKRGELWAPLPVGIFRGCQNYRTFVVSVLSFHMQLEDEPACLYTKELGVLRKFNPGPGNWFHQRDMFNLSRNYGFPVSFPSIRVMSLAAKLRVVESEALDAEHRAGRIFDDWLEADSKPFPLDWYESSHLRVLQRAIEKGQSMGVTTSSVRIALLTQAQERGEEPRTFVKKHFQREAYMQLLRESTDYQDVHERLRAKMKRWPSDLVPRVRADRARSLLIRLGRLVRPRVLSAVWRTLWNAWCTQRRFQKEGGCLFKCGGQARDCIEHYAFCPLYLRFRRTSLRLSDITSLDDFLLLKHPSWPDDRLILEAIALFSVYTSHNMARTGSQLRGDAWVDCMDRSSYHAVQNHRRSTAALSTVWVNSGRLAARPSGSRLPRARSSPPSFQPGGNLVTGENWS